MTEMERVPLAEAWRIATGKEPPVLTDEQKAAFDEQRRLVRERAKEIYAGLQPGEAA
jgi:hypothetical protein